MGQLALIYFLLVRERELLDTSFAVLTHLWAAACGEGAHSEVPELPWGQRGIGENRWKRDLPWSMGDEAGKDKVILCP